MALDPRIEVIREKYGLDKADFWELPQKKGTWLVKHAALEVAAAQAGIVFDNPLIIEASSAEGVAVISVRGELPPPADKAVGQSEWSTGEASPKNNKNAYPWAMAEKRAKDRVILKLIGIHGLVYSEDEMSDADERPPKRADRNATPLEDRPEAPNDGYDPKASRQTPNGMLKKDERELDGDMRKEILDCPTVDELNALWRSPSFVEARELLSEQRHKQLEEYAKEHARYLRNRPAAIPQQQAESVQ